MVSTDFEESTKELQKPKSMTDEECGILPVWSDNRECISKWKMDWKERLHCLFRGYVWVRVLSGHTQPPIDVCAERTVFWKN